MTAAVHLSVFTEKSRSEDGVVAHVPSYTSMVTYITSYRTINI